MSIGSDPGCRRRSRRSSLHLAKAIVEALESRLLLSYVVNTISDQLDASTSPTVSLRDAVNRANAAGGNQTITFDSSVFTPGTMHTITLATGTGFGSLVLDDTTLTLEGPGAGTLSINSGGTFRDIAVDRNSKAVIEGLTVTGGGIVNGGTLQINNSTISGNSVAGVSNGGGIKNYYGSLTIFNSYIHDNVCGSYGGGIFNSHGSPLTIASCTITGNTADLGGGGIYSSGTLDVYDNTVISGNDGIGSGGGVFVYNGTAEISHTTVSGNTTNSGSGAGIRNQFGDLTVTDCTITGNSCESGGGGIGNDGGTLQAYGSIIENNVAQFDGGGIENLSYYASNISDCTITGNTTGYSGGGIFTAGGPLYVSGTEIEHNAAQYGGGGIGNIGTATLTNSTVSYNSAEHSGGGIGNGGSLTVSGTAVDDNTSSSGGGISRRSLRYCSIRLSAGASAERTWAGRRSGPMQAKRI